jgi:hypothetical protein
MSQSDHESALPTAKNETPLEAVEDEVQRTTPELNALFEAKDRQDQVKDANSSPFGFFKRDNATRELQSPNTSRNPFAPENFVPYEPIQSLEPDFLSFTEQLERLKQRHHSNEAITTSRIVTLEHELTTQKTKYEALAKLYTQLRQEHLHIVSTVKNLRLKAAASDSAAASTNRALEELHTAKRELLDAREERDRAVAELRSLGERVDTGTGSSVSRSHSQRADADQISLGSVSEEASREGGDHWSLSQPVARQIANGLMQQNSVRSISSNRKVQVEPKSSFENLRR